jgi:tetratricopeptide (TPR) repeat protein/predicted Ser/Thr protein kinase
MSTGEAPIYEDPRIRLDTLFDQALDLEGEALARFLAELDAGEPALAAELRQLLTLAQLPGLQPRALAQPVWRALFEQASSADGLHSTSPTMQASDAGLTDFRIGVWRAVRTLGRGGMGTVYLVERDEGGFQQRGAMKLLRAGANVGEFSDEFLRRFEQERQILATLNHEGIAGLLDGGRDPQGRPYLVMEYVQGEPIDRACDLGRLSVDQRVALFVQVAQAVAYAHRNLIAHRDIKPGNILVGADGRAKLLDFGIAKALADQPIGEEPLTRTALRVFTPDYATPEQVHGQPASTATDVYQLGLLLYELLTGQRAQRVTDTTQRTLEHAICSAEPLRPSERVIGDIAASAARQTTPPALRRKLRGDLDNIVLKALRKEPERRYASANAMVEDLERWRQGRPVRARPETFVYRSGKFVRRHAWAVAAGVAIVAMIIGYAVTVTLQANALARERDRAQAEAAKALQVKTLVLRLFEGANPDASGSAQLSARELLDRGWAAIERELGGQPDVQIELLDAIGEAYRGLGVYDRAGALFERSLQIARGESSRHPLLLARALRSQGRVRGDLGEYASGEADLREALARYRAALGANHAEVATTLGDLARLLDLRGEFAGAEAGHREALAMHRRLHGERDLRVAESLGDLGMILRRQGDYAGAEPLLSQSLTLRRQLLPAQHPEIAYALTDLAQVRNDLGEYDSAEALYREALASMQTSLGDAHPSVALTMITLARVLKTRRDFDGARDLLLRALAIRRQTLGERHPSIALNLNDIGQTYLESSDSKPGDLQRAERYYREALDIYPIENPGRSMVIYNLGQVAEKRGDFAGAERQYRAALVGQRKHYGDEHDRVAMQLNRLGIVLYRQGRLDEAEAAMRQALAIYRKRLAAGHQRLAVVLLPLGQLLIERGRREEAEPLLREALKVRRDAFGNDDPRTAEAARALATAMRRR